MQEWLDGLSGRQALLGVNARNFVELNEPVEIIHLFFSL